MAPNATRCKIPTRRSPHRAVGGMSERFARLPIRPSDP
jgi:hypothetical protein